MSDNTAPSLRDWIVSGSLLFATMVSTFYVGAGWANMPVHSFTDLRHGWPFAVPLMAILVAHEMGHFIAGRIHGIRLSPPYFIPVPFFLLGTMGAVIRMREPIRSRNALLDVGAAGPLAGLTVALPVLVIGLMQSQVMPLLAPKEGQTILMEGHSPIYLALLWLTHGHIASGFDVMLGPTALAGWAGLLVTMINLLPVGQLDGGHVAYALFGEKQNHYGRTIRHLLPAVAIGVGAAYAYHAYREGTRGDDLWKYALSGAQWLMWWLLLTLMTPRRSRGPEHPQTDNAPLSSGRRKVAIFTLLLFPLLFMPSWLREL